MPSLAEKSWMAGVLDLKGRIYGKQNPARRGRQISLTMESKERLVVRRMSELTGTAPEMREAKPLSEFVRQNCKLHCPAPHVHVGEDGIQMPLTGRWTISGVGMVIVIKNLMPFFQVDRGYEEAIAEVQSIPAFTGRGSGQVMGSINRLHSLGWDVPEPYATIMEERFKQFIEQSE